MKILIIGATSAIAQGVARIYAERGASISLAGRDRSKLEIIAADLIARGATEVSVNAAAPECDIALIAAGALSENVRESIEVNFASVAENALELARRAKPGSVIAVITSVAGDRGRQSNFIYGSAKAGLDAFLSGLRNRFCKTGVHILTIKPGLVDTPMTAHLKKGPLYVSPDRAARGIVRAIESRADVAYVPWWWRIIMMVIRAIPEPIFKRMRL